MSSVLPLSEMNTCKWPESSLSGLSRICFLRIPKLRFTNDSRRKVQILTAIDTGRGAFSGISAE